MTHFKVRGYAKGEPMIGHGGYTITPKEDCWTLVDNSDRPQRSHDGFPQFTTGQQACWAAEFANGAIGIGREEAQADVRKALGIGEHSGGDTRGEWITFLVKE